MDTTLSDLFFDDQTECWPYRDAWWAILIHDGGRDLIIGLALSSLAGWILSKFAGLAPRWRRRFLYMFLCIGGTTGSVMLLKKVIHRHSPWNHSRYGGMVQDPTTFFPLFSLDGHEPSFPAGHAAGGFSLMGLFFVVPESNPRLKRLGLAIGLAVGTIFGLTQIVRGAHFLSHNPWSALIAWLMADSIYSFFGRTLELDSARG